jgi:hypothetical protein
MPCRGLTTSRASGWLSEAMRCSAAWCWPDSFESASELDSLRILEETGAAVSYRIVLRQLPTYAMDAFRRERPSRRAGHVELAVQGFTLSPNCLYAA